MPLPDENSKEFVAVLNKKVETGKLMNALGHMTAGLSVRVAEKHGISEMCFLQYPDKDNNPHSNISHFPFIVLKADNSNKIRTLRSRAIEKNLIFVDFTSTMTVGTSAEQQQRTKATPEVDLEYWGICLFGATEALKPLTKKFSLFQ